MTEITDDFNNINNVKLETNSEKLKLIKNTRGYNWEIIILSTNIDKIEKLNNEMLKRFGGEL